MKNQLRFIQDDQNRQWHMVTEETAFYMLQVMKYTLNNEKFK